MTHSDVIIIGGGVSGLMCARELAQFKLSVTVVERQSLAKESSWAGGGILSPLYPWRANKPISALSRWSQSAYPGLAQSLLENTGIDPELLPSGLLVLDCTDLDLAQTWSEAYPSRLEVLDGETLKQLEPDIGPTMADNPVFLPDIRQVRNPRLLRALRQELAGLGVAMLEHSAVEKIELGEGRVARLVADGKTHSAAAYVVCVGAWSGLLARATGLPDVQVYPVKGEMLIFDAPPGLLKHMVLSHGHYLIPRKDGRILAGSTVENVQFNKSASEWAHGQLLAFACGLLPELNSVAVEKHWAGLRPGSPQGIPTIGPHPEIENLYFNCGHFRNGFVMAPASARLLADHVLGRPPIIDPEPYLPLM